MAIIESVLNWKGFEGNASSNQVQYREKYQVTFDEKDDPRLRTLLAADNRTVGPNPIPQAYTSHPYNPWLYVSEVDTVIQSPMLVEVSVTYTNVPQRMLYNPPQVFANPCDQPWDIEEFTWQKSEPINQDVFGQPIVNANGEEPDPPLQDEFLYAGLRIRRNQSYWNHLYMAQFRGAINSDWFLGHAPYTAYCNNISTRRMRQGNFFYWEASFEFLFNDTFIDGQYIGWIKKVLHMGLKVYVNFTTAYNKCQIVRAQNDPAMDGIAVDSSDSRWNPTPGPVSLDKNGCRLPPGSKSFISYDVKPAMPFSGLEIYNI